MRVGFDDGVIVVPPRLWTMFITVIAMGGPGFATDA